MESALNKELEIAELLYQGRSYREIASLLKVSPKTISNARKKIEAGIIKIGEGGKARYSKKAEQEPEVKASPRLTLTEEQTKRLFGISHLEGGKDPLVIVDELLDYDSKMRRYGLTFSKMKVLSEALDEALRRGWKINAEPDFINAVTEAYNLGLLSWPSEALKFLLEVLSWAKRKGWRPLEFVNYVTRHYNELYYYGLLER
jgi:DNA-binding Lrp family transcriptional regulator